MNALSIRFHRFEQTLNSGVEWVESSPLPSRIFKISSFIFAAVAVGSLMPLNVTASLTISGVSAALSITAYVLSRLLHHKKDTLFEDVRSLGNVYEHSKELLYKSQEVKTLLKTFWTEEQLYKMLYDPEATELEKWAYFMIPRTIRYSIEGKKKDVETLYADVKANNQVAISRVNAMIETKRKDAMRCELTRSIFHQLSNALTKNIEHEELEEVKVGLEHCKETADFNAEEVEKILLSTNSEIESLEFEKAHLLERENRHQTEIEKLRRQLCREIYPLLQQKAHDVHY